MHGHELMRTGRTEEAIQEYSKANALEDAYYRREKIPAQYDWHHAHNLQLLALNDELLGRMKAAEQFLRQAFALPASTDFLAYNRRAWPEFLLERGRYREALDASRQLAGSTWPMGRLAGHTLAGEALLGLHRMKEARQELAFAEQAATDVPARVAAVLPYPKELRASLLMREQQVEDGERTFLDVEQAAIAMPGPDGWIAAIFTLNSIARQARDAGDWELAQYTAEEMIRDDPYYAGGHFALGLVAEHAGEVEGSRPMFAEAAKLWSHGDADLPELTAARAKLLAHQPAPL
jgi:tetratricopeptide (TPR) repeat protein